MIFSLRYTALLCCVCTLFALHPTPGQAAQGSPITLTMPSAALHQTISNMLPLTIEQNGQNKQFEGAITLVSISRFAINKNMISLQGQLVGQNMKMSTNIGGQNIQVNLGKLELPVTCDITLRYDYTKKTLFLTPRFQNPNHGEGNSAKTLLPLLNGLSKEYPVPLDKLAPFSGRIGSQTVTAHMEMVDIKAVKNELIIRFWPSQKRAIKR